MLRIAQPSGGRVTQPTNVSALGQKLVHSSNEASWRSANQHPATLGQALHTVRRE